MIYGDRYSPVNQFKTSVSARLVGVCGEVVPWSVDCILRGHFSHIAVQGETDMLYETLQKISRYVII